MRSILLTRPQDDSLATIPRIEQLGYRPVVAPFLAIERLAPALPRAPQAILVTSGNALAALPASPVPLLAVGDATAARARRAGFSCVRSAGGDAASLAELVTKHCNPAHGPLLLACGANQGKSLASVLRLRGFKVVRRVCYAALPVQRFPAEAALAFTSGTLHAVLFLSAETATAFVRLLPPELRHALSQVNAIAIAAAAAARLEPLPWRRVLHAPKPTLDALLALL